MKKTMMMLVLAAACQTLSAEGLKTAGDGTIYTLDMLSTMAGSGVEKWVDDEDGEVFYTLLANDTIAAGDKFVMEDDVSVLFDDDVLFVIEGDADFKLEKGSIFDSAYDDADYVKPVGIKVTSEETQVEFQHCIFYYVGLRGASSKGLKVTDCSFYNNNGAIGQGALTLGYDLAPFEVRGCNFDFNSKAAIAGAANYRNPLLIEDCYFNANGQANGNTPQLNLTVASQVTVRGCNIAGDPTKDRVGAIVVANMVGFTGELNTLIEDCTISNCRFGIATYLWQNAIIRNNVLLDNCHESNPMNGGSGINVYDPYYQQITRIEGNRIEGSLWGITLVGGASANLGRTDVDENDPDYNPGNNTFVNNGNGGVLYDLYNNSTNTVYAQGNTWNVSEQTEEEIEKVVFHQHDDASLGQVIFMPAATTTGVSAALMNKETVENGAYDLQGRKVRGGKKALRIVEGRKVVN
ncbi:MAG: hypothetical protein IJ892_07645 [Prevotella sp.]|nr:hypothetical protein [Prevotella sp.]